MNTDQKKQKKSKLPVVILFGPTAVGKTAFLSNHLTGKAEIINADSRQVYIDMDIGTAKVSPEEQKQIPHHLVDIKKIDQQFHTGDFVNLADSLVPEILERGHWPVISGGTAFYMRNFYYGLPESPKIDESIRRQVADELEELGKEQLFAKLKEIDPETAGRISENDTYRICRALEVYYGTGNPLSFYRVSYSPREEYRFLLIGLNRDRKELYDRINKRVDSMFDQGLLDELDSLLEAGWTPEHPGMNCIGYREILEAPDRSEQSLNTAKELIKRNSRRYAKRQITFFKNLPDVHWFNPGQEDKIIALIKDFFIT